MYSGWGAVLAVNLHGFDVGQVGISVSLLRVLRERIAAQGSISLHCFQGEAGWIGFYSTLAGIGAGFLLAR